MYDRPRPTEDRDGALAASLRRPAPEVDPNQNRSLSAEHLQRALNAMNNLVVLTDPRLEDNPLVWVNDYFCEFTGYERDEVLGRNCRFLQGEDRDQAARHTLRRAVEAGEDADVVLRNYKKDGTLFYNHLFTSPVFEDGEIVFFIGVQNDVTERETALRDVRDRERELHEAAENERERFGMDLHDGLGQELAGVSFMAKALQQRMTRADSAFAEDLDQLLAYIDSALGSARDMARGLNPVDASPHGLGDAIKRLCERVSQTHPDLTSQCYVEEVPFEDRRDARHLFRIAQEAMNNAAKHAQASEIKITLHRAPGSVQLEVSDNGTGIPDVMHLDSSRAPHEFGDVRDEAEIARRGMGLYGMRFRADLIGARLTICPRDAGGTVVRCVLPLGTARRRQHVRTGERE